MDLLSLALEAAPKALVYAAVILAVGACVAHGLFRLRASDGVSRDAQSTFDAGLRAVAKRASLLLVGALVLRAWAHTVAAFGFTQALDWESLRTIAWESQWSEGWKLQIAGAAALVVTAHLSKAWEEAGWLTTAVCAVALCYLLPLLGHAAGEPVSVFVHGSHILGAGVWLGTLGATTLVFPESPRLPSQLPESATVRRSMLSQFSPVAFAGSALLVATGLVAVWWYVGSLDRLVNTAYGRLLMLKLFLVADVATCGFLNWQRLRSAAPADSSGARAAFVALEVGLGMAVIAVTAILTEIEHP